MSFTLIIDRDALFDISHAAEWYEFQKKGLGIRFKKQVKRQISALKQNPFLFPIRYHEIRCRKIEKFPFLIHYQIDDLAELVTVYAIFHTSRNPEIWKKTKKKTEKMNDESYPIF